MARVRVSEVSVFGDEDGNKKAERVRLYFQDDQTMKVATKYGAGNVPLDLHLVSEVDWDFFNLGDEYRITIERVRTKRKILDENEINKAKELGIIDAEHLTGHVVPQGHRTVINAVYSDGVREFVPTEEEGNAGTEE